MDLAQQLHDLGRAIGFLGFLPRKVVVALLVPLVLLPVMDRLARGRR